MSVTGLLQENAAEIVLSARCSVSADSILRWFFFEIMRHVMNVTFNIKSEC